MRNSVFGIAESAHHLFKNNESIARLEAQHIKLIDSLQGCLRILKSLITKLDNRSKNLNDVQNKILQVHIEMRDMQREEYIRAEEQRQKASEQREKANNLLEEIIKTLQTKKET